MKNNKVYSVFKGVNDGLVKVETALMAISTIALVIVIAIEVVCRYALFISTAWAEELARYLFIWLTYIGSAAALYEGGHTEIDICAQLIERMKDNGKKEKAKQLLQVLALTSTLVFLVYFAKIFFEYMMMIWASTQTAPTMKIPMGLIYLPVFIGIVLTAYHAFYLLVNIFVKKG